VVLELHLKVSIEDHRGVVPRGAPLLIWEDPQVIGWSDEVLELLEAADETRMLVGEMPAGVHTRPEGGGGSRHIIILWPYHAERTAEVFPLPLPEHYAEVCVRGLATMLPGMDVYRERLPRPFIDGGYYTKTAENRPLACPLEVEGAYVHGALSGFGMMASQGTAELLALHLTGGPLPSYAGAFTLDRYGDPEYVQRVREWSKSAQL
jgi:glycine/D-amino acid oxidase-like deaminating enzyme